MQQLRALLLPRVVSFGCLSHSAALASSGDTLVGRGSHWVVRSANGSVITTFCATFLVARY